MASFATVDIDLGSPARRSGSFTITGSGFVTGKPVSVWVAPGPYTGKGTLPDEVQMDAITVSASVISSTQIAVWWRCATRVRGSFKFTYQIGG